jgi:3-phenylpropionate/trans-cinnamate dioxygenase ferredoxin subunit
MQSIDTQSDAQNQSRELYVCRMEDLPAGQRIRVVLPTGLELAVYNIDGELHAMDNLCPHRGAPLSEGDLCGHVIECWLHGWQFDIRTGDCLTVTEKIRTYEVRINEGVVTVLR